MCACTLACFSSFSSSFDFLFLPRVVISGVLLFLSSHSLFFCFPPFFPLVSDWYFLFLGSFSRGDSTSGVLFLASGHIPFLPFFPFFLFWFPEETASFTYLSIGCAACVGVFSGFLLAFAFPFSCPPPPTHPPPTHPPRSRNKMVRVDMFSLRGF